MSSEDDYNRGYYDGYDKGNIDNRVNSYHDGYKQGYTDARTDRFWYGWYNGFMIGAFSVIIGGIVLCTTGKKQTGILHYI